MDFYLKKIQDLGKLDVQIDASGIEKDIMAIGPMLDNLDKIVPALGIKRFEFRDIQDTNKGGNAQRCAVLRLWRRTNGKRATYRALLKILADINQGDAAEALVNCLGKAQDLSKSKRHLDRALKAGIVLVEIVTCIILGCAGAGKTCLKHIMFGLKPPDIRTSTNCTDKVARVDLHKFRYNNKRWQEIGSRELKELIATIIASMENELESFASTNDQKQKSSKINSADDSDTFRSSETKSEMFHYIAVAVDKIKDEIFEWMKEKTGALPVNTKSKWLYLTDSGGQPRFVDVLPFFIRTLSGAVYVFRHCESLEKNVVSKYYKKNICIGEQDSYATALDNLKYLIQMVKTRPSCNEIMPTVVMVGTRKKGCPKCDKSDNEPEDKDKKIKSMMENCKVDKMRESGDNIVHEIDITEHEGGDPVEELKYSIAGLPPSKEISFPIWWYVYELILDELTTTLNQKVLSFGKCEQIAMHLGFGEGEAEACLHFLHENNVIYYDPNVLTDSVIVDPQIPAIMVSLLVEICYLLQNKNKESKRSISLKIKELYDVEVNISSSIWEELKTRGTMTVEIFENFKEHYCFKQFSFEQLCKLFTNLYLMVSLPSTGEYFMPCLLEHLSPDEIEQYRKLIPSSSAVPLLLCFEKGLPHPGVFYWLVVYLMNNGWKFPRDRNCNLIMLKRNCITLEAATISTPCLVTLINSLSYFEIHAHDGESDEIFSEILKLVELGIGKASESLKYGTIKPELAFFCSNTQHNPEKSYHVGMVHQKHKLVCRHNGKPYNTDLVRKHTLWWKDDTQGCRRSRNYNDIDSAELLPLQNRSEFNCS